MKINLSFTRVFYMLIFISIVLIIALLTNDLLIDAFFMILIFLVYFYEMVKIPLFMNKYKKDNLAQVGKVVIIIIDVVIISIFIWKLIKYDRLQFIILPLLIGIFGVINLIVLKIYYSEQKYFRLLMHGLEVISLILLSIGFLFSDNIFVGKLAGPAVLILTYSILIKYSIKPKSK